SATNSLIGINSTEFVRPYFRKIDFSHSLRLERTGRSWPLSRQTLSRAMMDSTTISIRRARTDEAGLLSDLAFRSKAHWGYPRDWLERWRPELTVDPRALEAAPTFVAVAESSLLGFYHLTPTSRADACELDFLFVEPTAIGRGVGQALFA